MTVAADAIVTAVVVRAAAAVVRAAAPAVDAPAAAPVVARADGPAEAVARAVARRSQVRAATGQTVVRDEARCREPARAGRWRPVPRVTAARAVTVPVRRGVVMIGVVPPVDRAEVPVVLAVVPAVVLARKGLLPDRAAVPPVDPTTGVARARRAAVVRADVPPAAARVAPRAVVAQAVVVPVAVAQAAVRDRAAVAGTSPR
jgi:hypothetical protein